jgi:hypothetical protein
MAGVRVDWAPGWVYVYCAGWDKGPPDTDCGLAKQAFVVRCKQRRGRSGDSSGSGGRLGRAALTLPKAQRASRQKSSASCELVLRYAAADAELCSWSRVVP